MVELEHIWIVMGQSELLNMWYKQSINTPCWWTCTFEGGVLAQKVLSDSSKAGYSSQISHWYCCRGYLYFLMKLLAEKNASLRWAMPCQELYCSSSCFPQSIGLVLLSCSWTFRHHQARLGFKNQQARLRFKPVIWSERLVSSLPTPWPSLL